MSQPSRTDPPSSTDAMRPTSFIGATSTSYEEVNAEDDCYQGDYNVGIEADDDGVLNPTKKDVMRESQNTETTTSSDDFNAVPMGATTVPRSAVDSTTTRSHSNETTETLNHLRDSIGNVYNVGQLSNEVANSETRAQFLWNSLNLGIAAAGTISGFVKHSISNSPNNGTTNGEPSPGGVTVEERDNGDEEDGPAKPSSGVQGVATPTATPTTAAAPKNLRRVYAWVMIGVVAVISIVGISVGVGKSSSKKSNSKSIDRGSSGSGSNTFTEADDVALQEICTFLGFNDVNVCQSKTSWEGSSTLYYGNTIPNGIGLLTQLTSLTITGYVENYLSYELTGTIPATISNLVQLQHLSLLFNALTGTIPSSIGSLSSLTYLELYSNQLSGSIPSLIGGTITQLNHLSLGENSFSGTLPTLLGNLVALTALFLNDNALTGTIPSEIGNFPSMSEIFLSSNSLSGTVPTSIGNLRNIGTLNLEGNALTGTIPSEIGNLAQLVSFNASVNALTGIIPSSIEGLTAIASLTLGSNSLIGTIPTVIGLLTQLTHLDLNGNSFTGTIPSEVGNLVQLLTLAISGNSGVTGTIPSEIGNLDNLLVLSLYSASLFGTIPSTIGNLLQITRLYLSNNALSGEIPSSFANLINLDKLHLYGNPNLYGTMPDALCAEPVYERIIIDCPTYNAAIRCGFVCCQDINLAYCVYVR